jgi:hypothetical protein
LPETARGELEADGLALLAGLVHGGSPEGLDAR